jgi:hypothetical protein
VDLTPPGQQLLDDLAPAYGQVQAAIARAVALMLAAVTEPHRNARQDPPTTAPSSGPVK